MNCDDKIQLKGLPILIRKKKRKVFSAMMGKLWREEYGVLNTDLQELC
jgi:hypothetical protein